jgi:CheY-like chemotaxis protein
MGHRVLLAEDEALTALSLADLLEAEGYDVALALDGAEALEQARRLGDGLDALVTDLRMPRMGGEDLIRALRAERPGLPVVVVTGSPPRGGEEALRHHAGGDGPVLLLHKPAGGRQLAAALCRAITAGTAAPAADRPSAPGAGGEGGGDNLLANFGDGETPAGAGNLFLDGAAAWGSGDGLDHRTVGDDLESQPVERAGSDASTGGAGDDVFRLLAIAPFRATVTDFWPGAGSNARPVASRGRFPSREQALASKREGPAA